MIPKALGDALTQDSILGGWRKAGLTEEGYAHVLHGLPVGKRIGPQTSYPYIAGRILTTNSTIKEIREWFMKRKHQDTPQSHRTSSTQQANKSTSTTSTTQLPSPAKPVPSSPAPTIPSTPSLTVQSNHPPDSTQEERQESSKQGHHDLRKTAYKSPSFYASDNFPMSSSALADRVTRPTAVIMIDSDSEQEAHVSSSKQSTTPPDKDGLSPSRSVVHQESEHSSPSQKSSTSAPEPSNNSPSSKRPVKTQTSTIPPLSTPPPSDSDSDWGYHHNQLDSATSEELVLTRKDGRMVKRRAHRPRIRKGTSSTDTDSDKHENKDLQQATTTQTQTPHTDSSIKPSPLQHHSLPQADTSHSPPSRTSPPPLHAGEPLLSERLQSPPTLRSSNPPVTSKQSTTPETRQTPATPPPPPQNPQAAPTATPKKTRKGLKATERPVIQLVNPPPSSDSPRKKIDVDWSRIDQNSDDSPMADDEDLYQDLGPESDGVTDAVDESEEESSDTTQESTTESTKLPLQLPSESTALSKESTLSLYMSLNSNDSSLFDTVMDRESI